MLSTARYVDQAPGWPPDGRHVLAQFDEQSIVVYQAYRPSIGRFAAEHGFFGGEFRYSRMSWIKPNFLWMMYRSAWGTRSGQEVILALRLRRPFFDRLLVDSVPSTYSADAYPSEQSWKAALDRSSVRLQWDPDHDPRGTPVPRRALQLGLRGEALDAFGKREILEIMDISAFVAEQRRVVTAGPTSALLTPVERVYVPDDPAARARIGLC